MIIKFWKMHGAANDFILVDDRKRTFPAADKAWISSITARRKGVGSEGVILIQPSDKATFKMRFFNPDGSEVEMCGNGARCVARLAHDLKIAPAEMTIETVAGILKARMVDRLVQLEMTAPRDWKLDVPLNIAEKKLVCHFVSTGVPHAVVITGNLDAVDAAGTGGSIRRHEAFAPAGTNADFIEITGPDSLRIRTYERGVEAETLACGTGIVAGALIAARLGKVKPPVRVTAASGDVLTVDFKLTGKDVSAVTLLGPAVHVFKGEIEYARRS